MNDPSNPRALVLVPRKRVATRPDSELSPEDLARRIAWRQRYQRSCARQEFPALADTTFSYLAGLFDGEGSVSIQYTCGMWRLSITLSSSAENGFLRRLYEECDCVGSFSVRARRAPRRSKNEWILTGRALDWFLAGTLPWLRLKREAALVALAFRDSMKAQNRRKPVSAETTATRTGLMHKLHVLLAEGGSHHHRVGELKG